MQKKQTKRTNLVSNKRLLVSLFALLVLIPDSCVVYYPQTVDIPLLQEKKDFRAEAGFSPSPATLFSTLSYGITDHFAAQVYTSAGTKQRYNLHGALGYYKSFENGNVLEIYGGRGMGSVNGEWNILEMTGPRSKHADYVLNFSQINFGKRYLKPDKDLKFEFGTGIRSGEMFIKDYSSLYIPEDAKSITFNCFLLEPVAFISGGSDRIMLGFKFSACWLKKMNYRTIPMDYDFLNMGISIRINL